MEEIIESSIIKRPSFENFKSDICHTLKEKGDLKFVLSTLKSRDIFKYYKREWYAESLYLLAMVDYISRINNIPLCNEYDNLRKCKMQDVIYPSSILALYAVYQDKKYLKEAYDNAIPEFKKFNIVENEVRNVV